MKKKNHVRLFICCVDSVRRVVLLFLKTGHFFVCLFFCVEGVKKRGKLSVTNKLFFVVVCNRRPQSVKLKKFVNVAALMFLFSLRFFNPQKAFLLLLLLLVLKNKQMFTSQWECTWFVGTWRCRQCRRRSWACSSISCNGWGQSSSSRCKTIKKF